MTNPDELPMWLFIPLATIFWGWLILALLNDRRQRRTVTHVEWTHNPETGQYYPTLKTYVFKHGHWVEKSKPLERRLNTSE